MAKKERETKNDGDEEFEFGCVHSREGAFNQTVFFHRLSRQEVTWVGRAGTTMRA